MFTQRVWIKIPLNAAFKNKKQINQRSFISSLCQFWSLFSFLESNYLQFQLGNQFNLICEIDFVHIKIRSEKGLGCEIYIHMKRCSRCERATTRIEHPISHSIYIQWTGWGIVVAVIDEYFRCYTICLTSIFIRNMRNPFNMCLKQTFGDWNSSQQHNTGKICHRCTFAVCIVYINTYVHGCVRNMNIL